MIDAAIAAHNVDPNAHSYLARTNNPTFTGTAVFEHITLNGNMTVNAGAQIIINANGSITINGTITIHGKQLVISKDAPVNPANDLVWIKTFG